MYSELRYTLLGAGACGYSAYKFYTSNDMIHMVVYIAIAVIFLVDVASELLVMYEERPRPRKSKKKKKNLVVKRLLVYAVFVSLLLVAMYILTEQGITIHKYVSLGAFVVAGVISIAIIGDE